MPPRVLQRIDGADGPLIVEQQGRLRQLHFGNGITQSTIDTTLPGRLPLAANRAMLAHLMFVDPPRRVLLGGCGGGAIARWFHARDPGIAGTAVEASSEVAGLARRWFDFPDRHSGWRLEVADIRDHLARDGAADTDFILLDLEQDAASPDWLASTGFLAHCRQHLSAQGVLTLNWIADDAERFSRALSRIRQVFDRRTLCLPVPQHENVMILAFKEVPALQEMATRSHRAEQHWGLEFTTFLRRLQRSNPPGSGVF